MICMCSVSASRAASSSAMITMGWRYSNSTAQFVIDAAIDLPRFAILTPFPGTPLHRRLEAEGRILTRNWELYDGQHVVFAPTGMSADELAEGHARAWRSTYSMSSIARRLSRSRTQLPIAVMANMGYRFYAHNLEKILHLRLAHRPAEGRLMRLTLVHPAIGRRPGQDYIRSWQMESLPIAALAGLTPKDVEIAFYDDRLEVIDYDRPADLVAIPVETYTARRAYQIASEFRRRRVPVVMGGFHATLMPDEVRVYAESIVIGEAEELWPSCDRRCAAGKLKPEYRSSAQPDLRKVRYDRSILCGKRYLPLGLVETSRGCKFPCEFCAIQSFFHRTARHRPIDSIVAELADSEGPQAVLLRR